MSEYAGNWDAHGRMKRVEISEVVMNIGMLTMTVGSHIAMRNKDKRKSEFESMSLQHKTAIVIMSVYAMYRNAYALVWIIIYGAK